MTEWIGKTIGNVQIEGLLNRGGLTEVYTGTHLILQRPVVIKLLYSYLEENPAVLEKFHRVAEAVVGLRHPHIVQVFEFDTTDGHPFMVMDYVKGPTLTTYLQNLQRRKKRMATDQVAGLLKGLAAALDYAHAQGLVHRDIKPGNILLHNDGKEIPLDRPLAEDVEAILTDFGLVDVVHLAPQTASAMVSGSAAYMAPEQARGDRVDHRIDIYSFGVVLYEMLAGHMPFEASNPVTILHMQVHTAPSPIPALPSKLQAVLDRALAKKPEERYQTAQELANDFYRSIGLPVQAEVIPEALMVKTAPIEVPPPRQPEQPPTPQPQPKSQPPVKSQPGIAPVSQTKAKPQVEPVPHPKRTRSWLWIGVGLFSLVCLGVLGIGALRFFPTPPKPVEMASPVIPTTSVSPQPSETTNLPSAEGMVQVPDGTYNVGALPSDNNHIAPQKIHLDSFWIDKYLITYAQYQQYMTETGAQQPVTWPGAGDHPVLGVTWEQAQAYCGWLKKHLPIEAQWEAAGRGPGPAPRMYPWGDDSTAGGQANNLPDEDTYAVGAQSFNQSPFGVFDMVGNVWEWVGEPYAEGQAGYHILRGGRYGLPINDLSYRLSVAPDNTRYLKYTGFRCAADQVK